MDYKILDEAKEELREAMIFYNEERPGLGLELLDRFEETLEFICDFPLAATKTIRNTRKSSLKQFPFSIIYKVNDDLLTVISVAHQKRRPGYWKNRL
ncbi:MAG: type II toxin-antitoxin system RelE/ParE family toxin [Lentisphaerales bacterium]|nr:type II toxin-antitoxin system RelE/ParE family toxin [Lentisphaerales bacterium]